MTEAPLPFVWPHAAAFWLAWFWAFFVSEWSMARRSTATAPPADTPEHRSLVRAMQFAFLAQLLAFLVAPLAFARLPAPATESVFWCGFGLLLAGSLLRRHCFRMLGDSFTVDVRAAPQQAVVSRGAYAWVRHPGYTAGLAMVVGVGLMLGSVLSLVLMFAVALHAYTQRIRVEEALLARVIGAPYAEYAAKRKRLIPGIW